MKKAVEAPSLRGTQAYNAGSQHTPAPPQKRLWRLLGPAFVAAVAYVDPGNVASNISAGARYGYLLVWVLVTANAMAVIIQYQSAKLGIVTGKSLPALLGQRLRKPQRIAFWAQAEIIAAATDLAEIIGGAIALHLLFGLPMVIGGAIIALVSLGLLLIQDSRKQHRFEIVIMALLAVITMGFMAGLLISPPSLSGIAHGLVPRFAGTPTVALAASMLGATVMPHAIYLHSSLVLDRHGNSNVPAKRLLHATRVDVIWALALAGSVNIALLLLAASALPKDVPNADTIAGAHAAITHALGPTIGVIFAVGLLASSLASTSVGAYAGSEIMAGLLHIRVPLVVRRLVTVIPALVLLQWGVDPTWALVISQAVLSFGIAAALIPLMIYTRKPEIMGQYVDCRALQVASFIICTLVIALNLALLALMALGYHL